MKYTSLKIDSNLFYMDKADEITKEILSLLSDLNISTLSIVKIECILPVHTPDELVTCSEAFSSVLQTVFEKQQPANTLLAQELINSNNKAMLRFTICDDHETKIEYKEFQKHNYCLLTKLDEKVLVSGGIHFQSSSDALRSVQQTFDFVEQLLDHEEMHFGHIAHQSNYLSDIQSDNKDPLTGWTTLQTIEEIRSLYYDPNLFKHGYPLQVINHIQTEDFITDFIAAYKDGFPTAQFDQNDSSEQTQSCYIRGLNQVFVNPTIDEACSSSEEQLNTALKNIKEILKASTKQTSDVFEEIKITIANKNDFEIIEQLVAKSVDTNKLSLFAGPLKDASLKVSIEAIATIVR
ncbi:hypothetical protein [Carboxylicivirga marina]|uniref:hypothetical protein n=1 Tax=Carboxylicivirga marina TaxID=2800988 RepID=UPI0025966A15|nr:hypothetical protein [uncultured Carboxylicivirga sp.]